MADIEEPQRDVKGRALRVWRHCGGTHGAQVHVHAQHTHTHTPASCCLAACLSASSTNLLRAFQRARKWKSQTWWKRQQGIKEQGPGPQFLRTVKSEARRKNRPRHSDTPTPLSLWGNRQKTEGNRGRTPASRRRTRTAGAGRTCGRVRAPPKACRYAESFCVSAG